jgi:hypothetical protein
MERAGQMHRNHCETDRDDPRPWRRSAQLDNGKTHQRCNEMAADQRPRLRWPSLGRAQQHHDRRRERSGRQRKSRGAGEHFHAADGNGAADRAAHDGKQSNPVKHAAQTKQRQARRNWNIVDAASAPPITQGQGQVGCRVEAATRRSGRSGGRRRTHNNLLVKGTRVTALRSNLADVVDHLISAAEKSVPERYQRAT